VFAEKIEPGEEGSTARFNGSALRGESIATFPPIVNRLLFIQAIPSSGLPALAAVSFLVRRRFISLGLTWKSADPLSLSLSLSLALFLHRSASSSRGNTSTCAYLFVYMYVQQREEGKFARRFSRTVGEEQERERGWRRGLAVLSHRKDRASYEIRLSRSTTPTAAAKRF